MRFILAKIGKIFYIKYPNTKFICGALKILLFIYPSLKYWDNFLSIPVVLSPPRIIPNSAFPFTEPIYFTLRYCKVSVSGSGHWQVLVGKKHLSFVTFSAVSFPFVLFNYRADALLQCLKLYPHLWANIRLRGFL